MPYMVEVHGWLDGFDVEDLALNKWLQSLHVRYEHEELKIDPRAWVVPGGWQRYSPCLLFAADIPFKWVEELEALILEVMALDAAVHGFFYIVPIDGDLPGCIKIEYGTMKVDWEFGWLYDDPKDDPDLENEPNTVSHSVQV